MMEVIRTINLTKTYGEINVVDNLNLSVKKGEIFGFIGLNGAGKTTAIRMLLGMIAPASGECYIKGQKVSTGNINIWHDVGYIVETPYSYPELTVRENLEIICKLRDIKDESCVDWIIRKLKLEEYELKKAKHLSLGNSQRLGIAKAIIHKPGILILDEPTNGLDPAGIVEVRKLLKDLAEQSGVTVFISSHKLDEISKITTKIGIIHNGKLIKEIGGEELDNKLKKSLLLDGKDREAIKSILSEAGYNIYDKVANLIDEFTPLQIKSEDAINNPEKVAALLVNSGHPPTLLKVEKEDLEMYFLRVIEEIGGNLK